MPTYEYECEDCGEQFSVIYNSSWINMGGNTRETCDVCKSTNVRKLPSIPMAHIANPTPARKGRGRGY